MICFYLSSLAYNYFNKLTVNHTVNLSIIYGEQEKQLHVREPELFSEHKNTPKEIITIGGSTTWGSGITPISENNKNILPEKDTFPFQLNTKLNSSNYSYQVSNLGIVGASTICTLNVLKFFDINNSKILIVHNGYNDLPIFRIKDNSSYFLNTENKKSFCMYESKLSKIFYDIQRTLSYNFPIISKYLNKNLVNGDKDVYLGFELTNQDLFTKIPLDDIMNYSLKHEVNFLKINKLIIEYAEKKGLKVLFIIEPSIEEYFTPNGSSFKFQESTHNLKLIHLRQQNQLKNLIISLNDENIKYLDSRDLFRNNQLFFYDEIHFNSLGNELLAKEIFYYLKQLNWLN